MDLIVKNRIITEPIINILYRIKRQAPREVFKDIQEKPEYIRITCPNLDHKGGQESHPSCSVYSSYYSDTIMPGTVHCFTCGYTASLPKLVSDCFNADEEFGKNWLAENFGEDYLYELPKMGEIKLPEPKLKQEEFFLDPSVLEDYNYWHPYMEKRKLTKEIVSKFKIGYDKATNSLTFPVWDEKGNLVTITRRSVEGKRFELQPGQDKLVYLLNFVLNEHADEVYVCESQINALTCWKYGLPAIALFGTGSKKQYEILNRQPISRYVLCFDGDEAGRKGAERFKQNINGCAFIYEVKMPPGKDVNDLSEKEFKFLVDNRE